jgi:hypothetical protein
MTDLKPFRDLVPTKRSIGKEELAIKGFVRPTSSVSRSMSQKNIGNADLKSRLVQTHAARRTPAIKLPNKMNKSDITLFIQPRSFLGFPTLPSTLDDKVGTRRFRIVEKTRGLSAGAEVGRG